MCWFRLILLIAWFGLLARVLVGVYLSRFVLAVLGWYCLFGVVCLTI